MTLTDNETKLVASQHELLLSTIPMDNNGMTRSAYAERYAEH